MNSIKRIITIVILVLGFHLAISILINNNFDYPQGNNFGIIDDRNESILKRAGYWEIGKIEIDDNDPTKNWSTTEAVYDWCSGSGTINNPYIIENVSINREYTGNCIDIRYSNAFFIIRNCTVYNSGYPYHGIYLNYVDNAQILNTYCSQNTKGIFFQGGGRDNIISNNTVFNNLGAGISLEAFYENCVISGNVISDNRQDGIVLRQDCDNNTIRDNIIYNSGYSGILVQGGSDANIVEENKIYNGWCGITVYDNSNFNSILSNEISNWEERGIRLIYSDNNTISGNKLIGNDNCTIEENCEGNIFENNYCGKGDEQIPGYNLFILLGILSFTLPFLIRKMKLSNE